MGNKKKAGQVYFPGKNADKLFKQAFPVGVKDAIKLVPSNPDHMQVNVDDPERKRRNRTKTT